MKKIISIFLLTLLSFPSFIGLHHLVNEDHTLCNEQKVHLHEQELDCFTCEYIRISFDYNFNDFEYLDNSFSFFHENIIIKSETPTSFFINYFYLRGPPSNYLLS